MGGRGGSSRFSSKSNEKSADIIKVQMKGSEKQIKWAEDIREQMNAVYDKAISLFEAAGNYDGAKVIRQRQAALNSHAESWDIINLFGDTRISGKSDPESVANDFRKLHAVYRVRLPETLTAKKLLLR